MSVSGHKSSQMGMGDNLDQVRTSIQPPLPLETNLIVVSPKNEGNSGMFTPSNGEIKLNQKLEIKGVSGFYVCLFMLKNIHIAVDLKFQ